VLRRAASRPGEEQIRPLCSSDLGLSFPVFDKGVTSAAVQQARIQEENSRLALADQRQSVALDVRRPWLTLESTRQLVNARNALAFQNALLPCYTGELDPAKALLDG